MLKIYLCIILKGLINLISDNFSYVKSRILYCLHLRKISKNVCYFWDFKYKWKRKMFFQIFLISQVKIFIIFQKNILSLSLNTRSPERNLKKVR